MNKDEYKKLVKSWQTKEPKFKNAIISFLVGGSICVSGQIIAKLLMICFGISEVISYSIVCLLLIFLSSLFTGLGFFDDWVSNVKCGLIIPTTGFAHSMTSCAMEYRKDGLITGVGSNFFKLAGSVLLYGIISAFFLCLIKVVFYG